MHEDSTLHENHSEDTDEELFILRSQLRSYDSTWYGCNDPDIVDLCR